MDIIKFKKSDGGIIAHLNDRKAILKYQDNGNLGLINHEDFSVDETYMIISAVTKSKTLNS